MHRPCSAFALSGVLLAAVAGACSSEFPVPVTGPQTVLVIDYEIADAGAPVVDGGRPSSGGSADGGESADPYGYQLATVQIQTLTDLRTLQGSSAKFIANGHVNADYAAMAAADPMTATQLQTMTVLNAGGPVDFDYFSVAGSGGPAIYPDDADSLNMVTTYYNVEVASLAFQALDAGLPGPIPVYYAPEFTSNPATVESSTDIGITDPALGLLVVTPTVVSNTLAPSMQPGVIAYEYAANVFQLQAFFSFGPTLLDVNYGENMMDTGWQQTVNIASSFRAGFSDFFAAVIVQDPQWVHTTGSTIDPTRDLTALQCWTGGSTLQTPRAMYEPHALGSAFAAILWDSEENFPTYAPQYNAALITAMASFGKTATSNGKALTLAEAADSVVSKLEFDESIVQRFCSMLVDRLGLTQDTVPTCAPPLALQGLGMTCK